MRPDSSGGAALGVLAAAMSDGGGSGGAVCAAGSVPAAARVTALPVTPPQRGGVGESAACDAELPAGSAGRSEPRPARA
eukprot:6176826-Prymnesium_polylepis.1